jgi:hypothetical protein
LEDCVHAGKRCGGVQVVQKYKHCMSHVTYMSPLEDRDCSDTILNVAAVQT